MNTVIPDTRNAETYTDKENEMNLVKHQFETQCGDDFCKPFVDIDEQREQPVPHRYIHGGFKDNGTRFSLYLPLTGNFTGRFFQYVMPSPGSENATQGTTGQEDKIGFSIRSGSAYLETNGGGEGSGRPDTKTDPTYAGYRAIAACATFAREIMHVVFPQWTKRAYGYLFGVSGGAYRTLAAAEHTNGVWDGFVPGVPGSLMAIPNVFAVRMLAQRVLAPVLDHIADAVEPGGTGNPYAGLTDEQSAVLREVTAMGFPIRSWFDHRTMGTQSFTDVYWPIKGVDAQYFTDFWTKPGYEGSDPHGSFALARRRYVVVSAGPITREEADKEGLIAHRTLQTAGGADHAFQRADVNARNIVGFRIASALRVDVDGQHDDAGESVKSTDIEEFKLGGEVTPCDGKFANKTILADHVTGDAVIFTESVSDDFAIESGTRVTLDNSGFLAMQAYHRHQVPQQFQGFDEWNQFRDQNGRPTEPQRPLLIGPMFVRATGCTEDGTPHGKVIAIASLMDREAFPWQADWYAQRVRKHFGTRFNDMFRLWYTDHAMHADEEGQKDPTHTVSYLGVQEEALLQLAQWVEKGQAPSPSTRYGIHNGQVVVPSNAQERGGVQPVVTLSVNGGPCAHVKVGENVKLRAVGETPNHAPLLDMCEWDCDADQSYEVKEHVSHTKRLVSERAVCYQTPGTRFVTVRMSSQRDFPDPVQTRIYNIARVRIVVSE